MRFIADLHVHSRYSIATAKNSDLENLYMASQIKGISVVGTGDITHPKWFSQVSEKLEPADGGLYQLKKEVAKSLDDQVPSMCHRPVRFILVSEISNVYKKDGKTRKNHNLVFLPDLEAASNFNRRLSAIGNIHSDGRPILGLSARDLLEITLETSDSAFLVPAHIWTPWFSMFGSKSGFDHLKECFDDLSEHIFAVETGLSSDPEMNWRVSELDELTLISNSDAHSPMKLGREANIFETEDSFVAIRDALSKKNKNGFSGTIEFYPEEGKYHLDGHRKCGIRFTPEQSAETEGICPVCGKPLTLGVLNRVVELADRPIGYRPAHAPDYINIVPLQQVISEITGVGVNSKKVNRLYQDAVSSLGSEFDILMNLPEEELERSGVPLLKEAVIRIREKKIHIEPGYDGEFGIIRIFDSDEKKRLIGQKSLFSVPEPNPVEMDKILCKNHPLKKVEDSYKGHKKTQKKPTVKKKDKARENVPKEPVSEKIEEGKTVLNEKQRYVVEYGNGPLLIVAGPGTGKTLTITHRMARLAVLPETPAGSILAVTFTRKAAEEMKTRVANLLNSESGMPMIGTFHSLCLNWLKELNEGGIQCILDDEDRKKLINDAVRLYKQTSDEGRFFKGTTWISDSISKAKTLLKAPDEDIDEVVGDPEKRDAFTEVYKTYQRLLSSISAMDYDDLIFTFVKTIESDSTLKQTFRSRYQTIFVDEYQDLNMAQYRLVRLLAPSDANICVIGDPNQSIYGFRGSDSAFFTSFGEDYPTVETVHLTQNYRSSKVVVEAATQLIAPSDAFSGKNRLYSDNEGEPKVGFIEAVSEKAEAVSIGRLIEKLVGGAGFHSIDFGKIDGQVSQNQRSFSDIAVLYRTGRQAEILSEVLQSAGIPVQVASRERILDNTPMAKLISLLKIAAGQGNIYDLVKLSDMIGYGPGTANLERFKIWCFKKNLSLSEAIINARRIPIPGLSMAGQTRLVRYFDEFQKIMDDISDLDVAEKIEAILEKTRLRSLFAETPEVSESILQTKAAASSYSREKLADFILHLSTQTDTDCYDHLVEKVTLMTMHAAKGLEFPVVFVAGCEDGLIPHKREKDAGSDKKGMDLDEERRLFFVAATRAKEYLIFTMAGKRRIFGRTKSMEMSPFIWDIEETLINRMDEGFRKKGRQMQMSLF